MHDNILATLRNLEREKDIRILFAAESGSRAWGFASPDSDYDIRVLYTERLPWYLSLQTAPKDTFQAFLPGELDISAWELRKALRLFAGCNPSMTEWFDSPSIYWADSSFLDEIRHLIPLYFNPNKAAHHYLSMAHNALNETSPDSTIDIKKLFYALRGILAALWSTQHQTMPPTEFASLLSLPSLSPAILQSIHSLLKQKTSTPEHFLLPIPSPLQDFIDSAFLEIKTSLQSLSFPKPSVEPLEKLLLKTLLP